MTSDDTTSDDTTPEDTFRDPADPSQRGTEEPIEAARFAWPDADLDPVARMWALAAALPHCAIRETVLDAPFDRVWDFISDFEASTPRYEGAVTRLEVLEHFDEGLRIRSKMITGFWIEADVVLRPGWCLMESRFGHIGMAARPEDATRTRFVHFEGSTLLSRILKPYFHWNIGGDFRRLNALLG
jgi:hypothetical protein